MQAFHDLQNVLQGKDGTTNPEQSCWYCKDTGHELPKLSSVTKEEGSGGS